MITDPQTPEEWQVAVEWAIFLLALDSARQFGLIEGAPAINVDRALAIAEAGEFRGVKPRADYFERCLSAMREAGRRDEASERPGAPPAIG